MENMTNLTIDFRENSSFENLDWSRVENNRLRHEQAIRLKLLITQRAEN